MLTYGIATLGWVSLLSTAGQPAAAADGLFSKHIPHTLSLCFFSYHRPGPQLDLALGDLNVWIFVFHLDNPIHVL